MVSVYDLYVCLSIGIARGRAFVRFSRVNDYSNTGSPVFVFDKILLPLIL